MHNLAQTLHRRISSRLCCIIAIIRNSPKKFPRKGAVGERVGRNAANPDIPH